LTFFISVGLLFFQKVHFVTENLLDALIQIIVKMNLHHRETLILCLALAWILAGCLSREAKDFIYQGADFFCYLSHDLVSTQQRTPSNTKSGHIFKQHNTCIKEKMGEKTVKIFFSFHL